MCGFLIKFGGTRPAVVFSRRSMGKLNRDGALRWWRIVGKVVIARCLVWGIFSRAAYLPRENGARQVEVITWPVKQLFNSDRWDNKLESISNKNGTNKEFLGKRQVGYFHLNNFK